MPDGDGMPTSTFLVAADGAAKPEPDDTTKPRVNDAADRIEGEGKGGGVASSQRCLDVLACLLPIQACAGSGFPLSDIGDGRGELGFDELDEEVR